MENRRDLFRKPEVSVTSPRPLAAPLFRACSGSRQEPQGKSAKLVHGFEPAAWVLGNDANLSPYRSDQRALRPARGAVHVIRGGTGAFLGAPSAQPRGTEGRAGNPGHRIPGGRKITLAATQLGLRS